MMCANVVRDAYLLKLYDQLVLSYATTLYSNIGLVELLPLFA